MSGGIGDGGAGQALPMAGAPTVTVAIACYNQGVYLWDAIESILAQTRPVEAIIAVDDGSRDMTDRVCALYPQVRYHRQANGGLSAARNTGLRLATTSHILFLDSDDVLLPDAIERALDRFAQRPDAAFVYGGYREVTALRDPIAERQAVEKPDAFAGLIHDNHIGMHGTVLYDAAALRGVGGFDTSLSSCEDWDVYLKLARDRPIAAYPGIAAEYRRHAGNMSLNRARMIEMGRRVIDRQRALGLSAEQERAARAGVAFNTRFYSLQIFGELARWLPYCARLFATGCRLDRKFLPRFASAAFARLTRRTPAA